MKGSQKLNVKVVLGVSKSGLYIYEYPSMEKKALYTYKQIRSWSHGEGQFCIKTDDQNGAMHLFQTQQGSVICSLIEGYVLRILATIAAQ